MRYWTCRRRKDGVVCKTRNPRVKQRCVTCGAPRPAPSRPAHLAALDAGYETFVELNGGERCGICGATPKPGRRLHRDHDHRTGQARGLLCFPCNGALRSYMTLEWLEAAAGYLRRAARHAGRYTDGRAEEARAEG